MLVSDILRDAATVSPGAVCATLEQRELTFGELAVRTGHMVQTLLSIGIAKGDRIACWSDISLDVLPVFGAAAQIGAVFAPLDGRLGADEVLPLASYLRPRVLISDRGHAADATGVAVEIGALSAVFGVEASTLTRTGPGRKGAPAASPRPPAAGPKESDPHIIYLTSGSTGRPKGVVVSHRASWLRSFPGDCFFTHAGGPGLVCMFPQSHFAGWNFTLECWQRRRAVHYVRSASADALLAEVARRKASHLYGIPAVWERILETDASRYDCSSLRQVDTGTSAAMPHLLERVQERFPWCELRVYYGSTEGGMHTSLAPWDLWRKLGSVGKAVPGCRVVLAEDGEILVANEAVMSEYWDAPQETAQAFDGDFYRTGDVGTLDPEGYLTIVGRKREIIRTGGESVAPVEVEALLRSYPGVADVAVFGVPDAQWGEVVCAAVVMGGDLAPPGVSHVRSFLEDKLAAYKHPRRILAVDAIPRTPATGQVKRALLRQTLTDGGTGGV
jgi:fatty-acyl-CoA synthase